MYEPDIFKSHRAVMIQRFQWFNYRHMDKT